MVQNINQAQAMNAMQGVNFGQGNAQYYNAPPMQEDSFNGKTLLTLATIASAVIFRKQIGNLFAKYFPKGAEFFSNKISTPIKNFLTKHQDNFLVKGLNWAKTKFINAESWVKNLFKPAAK